MIITCNECSTSFKLDDSLIKGNGSKVRCSICKNVFTVFPISGKPEKTEKNPPDLISEPTSDFIPEESAELGNTSDFNVDDTDFSFEEDSFELDIGDDGKEPEEQDFEFETEDIAIDSDNHQDNGLDGIEIEFETMEIEPDEFSLSMEDDKPDSSAKNESDFLDMDFDHDIAQPEDPDLKLDTAAEGEPAEEEFELEFDVDDDSTVSLSDGPDQETDDSSLESVNESEETEEALSLEETEPDETLEEITPEDEFSDYDPVLEQETRPGDDSDDEKDEEDTEEKDSLKDTLLEKSAPLMDLPERRYQRTKRPLVSFPVLILLLVFLVAAGAYVASVMTGYKIPYLSDINIPIIEEYLKKAGTAAKDIKPIPNDSRVEGRFVSNTTGGTLFVITGRVDNPSNLSFSHIEVQGTLSTKENPAVKTKNVFCGTIITEEMLKSGTVEEMMKLLSVREGNNNSNVNIKPGASVPFMIVFNDLPEKLENFYVKVVGFDKTPGN